MHAKFFLSTLLAAGVLAGSALAEDYVLDNSATETNGGGAIPAQIGTGDSLTVAREGSVTTTDNFAHATAAGNGATIVNLGFLSTSGEDAYGMRGDFGNWFTNHGSISTAGLWAAGIYGTDENVVINTGTIATTGMNATGIRLANDNAVWNSGAIYTDESGGTGIYAWGTGNEIIHSGTIITNGSNARGIYAGGNSTVTNSGTILTRGTDSYGISVISGGTEITHSGKIISDQSIALYLSGTGNTLNLEAPAMIGGLIRSLDPVAVNIVAGPSHSAHWTFQGDFESGAPVFTGPGIAIFNPTENVVATYDATAFSAADVTLDNLSSSILGLALARSNSARLSRGGSGAESNPHFADLWVAGLVGSSRGNGSDAVLPYRSEHFGLAAGLDRDFGDFSIGGMAGASGSRFTANSAYLKAQDVEAKGGFAAIYGSYGLRMLDIDFALAGGWLDFTHTRAINDNLAPSGISSASSEYTGWWLSPAVTFSLPFEIGADWTVTPNLGGRYVTAWIDGYSEQGAFSEAANADVGSRRTGSGEIRLGLGVDRAFVLPAATGHFGINAGIFSRSQLGGDPAILYLNGASLEGSNPSHDIEAGFLAATGRLDLGDGAQISFVAESAAGRDGYRHASAHLLFSARF